MDNNFKNYKEYCDGFTNENVQFSFLLLLLRDNLFNLKNSNEIGLSLLCKNDIQTDISLVNNDIFSNIAQTFLPSFKFIFQNMSTKLVNENLLMPVSKAKKLNSYSINWLSHKPGNTVKQKLAMTNNKIMAGRRYNSYDTLENRMFKALCLRLEEYLSYKFAKVPKENISSYEFELFYAILKFKKAEFFHHIGRYEPTTPNNRLLGDRHYKNVRASWIKLAEINNILCFDIDKIYSECAIIFYIGIIAKLSKKYRFAQEIILIDYDNFDLNLLNQPIEFVINAKDNHHICSLSLDENNIYINILEHTFTLNFDNNNLTLTKIKTILTQSIYSNFDDLIEKVLDKVLKYAPVDITPTTQQKNCELPKNLVIDLYSTRPNFVDIDGNISPFFNKIILLKYNYENLYKVFVDDTKIIPITENIDVVSFYNVLHRDSISDISQLLRPIKSHKIKNFTFIYPDKFDEFQLKEFHINNMHYFSRSMGLIFDFQYGKKFNLNENDFVLSVDLIDNNITFTLVKAKYEEKLEEAIPKSKGIVWERYPTNSIPYDKYKDKVISILNKHKCPDPELLLESIGIETLLTEKDNLSFRFNSGYFHITSEIVDSILAIKSLNIDDLIQDYLKEKEILIEDNKVKIISCVNIFKGLKLAYNWFDGYEKYSSAYEKSGVTLWIDYVPSLYLKRLEENFMLCNGNDIKLVWGVEHRSEIEHEFVLASGIDVYEFHLLMGDQIIPTNKAILKSKKAFPLSEPVTCKLTMIYEYGGEEPYVLLFNSVDSDLAPFTQLKAEFIPISSYECENMPAPPFPEQEDWDYFLKYPNLKNPSKPHNLIDWTTRTLKSVQNDKNICRIDLDEHYAEWRVSRSSKYTCDVNNINFNEQFFIDEFDEDKTVFYFTKHEDKFDYDRFIAKDISYDYEKVNKMVIKNLNKSLFAFHTVFFNSRIIDNPRYNVTITNGYHFLKDILTTNIKRYERCFYFSVLGLISHNFDESCLDIVKIFLDKCDDESIRVGLYLGDISKDNTKEIFKYILEKYTTPKDIQEHLIPIISIALWKNENLIFYIHKFDDKLLLSLLENSIDFICTKLDNIDVFKTQGRFKKRFVFKHLEFILAILRLRNLNNSKLNSTLSMNNKLIQKLVKSLEILKTSRIEVDTLLSIETTNKVDNPLLYTTLKYLYNDTLDESFIIKAPTE